jgi:hypothetical protein
MPVVLDIHSIYQLYYKHMAYTIRQHAVPFSMDFIYSRIEHPYNPDTVRYKHSESPGTRRSHFKQTPSRKSLEKKYKHT